ncbi:MAG: ATP-binding protein [Candidatus Methanomethylicaceae archaeon]
MGRDALLSHIFTEIKKGKHVLLTGRTGLGKTTILEALHDGFLIKGSRSIFVAQTNPMKPCLEDMVEELHRNSDLCLYEYESDHFKAEMPWNKLRRTFRRMVIKDLCSIIIRSLQDAAKKETPPRKYIIFLDHLEKITPAQEAFFSTLSHHATLVGATDEKKPSKHLKRVWWLFKEIEIQPLEDKEIKEIAGLYIDKSGLLVEDRELFLTSLTKESRGNPLACANILAEYQGERVIQKSHIRQFHAEAGVKEIDVTPVFLLAMAVGIASRFLALGMNDASLYVLAGFMYAGFYFFRFFFYKALKQ